MLFFTGAGVLEVVGRADDGLSLVRLRQLLVELALQVGLGPGREDAGPPELVDDEQEDQQPEGHQRPADARDRTSHGGDGTGCEPVVRRAVVGPVRRVRRPLRKLPSVPHPRSPELWLRCVRLRSAVCMLGRFPALAGADLEVDAGEIVLLSGPNGAGKTTLLRLCAGLLPLRAGEAEVLGVDLSVEPRRVRRAVALVGHETFCYDDLTVAENVRFVGTLHRAPRRPTPTPRSNGSGCNASPNVAHGRLSQGQRRRLVARERARAQAAAAPARRAARRSRRAGPRGARRRRARRAGDGCTVLLASHELDLARRLATREVRIVAGQVQLPVGAHDGADAHGPRRSRAVAAEIEHA